ncbi:MAG TPA: Rrf2 family transcriptional regulator [Pseudobdellovibrionaceae bacterium]|nr:Rrf2 family transcriptional regulator [Pseudobdellovibrionaceae bacterium]
MNRIHRKVEYALMSLKHMRAKAPGERSTVKEIATAYKMPPDMTARVLQTLSQHGLLDAEQGVRGGYYIAKDLQHVSLHDLMEMLMGPFAVARCLGASEEGQCDMVNSCNIVSPIQSLNRKIGEFYKSLSLAELIESKPQRVSERRAEAT